MTDKLRTSRLMQGSRNLALALAATLACSASFAEKPEWAGGGKGDHGNKHGEKEQGDHGKHGRQQDEYRRQGDHDNQREERDHEGKKSSHGPRADTVRVGGYFGDHQRVVVRDYYGEQFRAGRCPPGLAKKNNGCMPPGQAKKYRVGQPLARSVPYYPVPQNVAYQLGMPPSGYRYVRVSSDILLLSIGTSMVVDAIQNLGGL